MMTSAPRQRRPQRLWPKVNYYEALLRTGEKLHPIDEIVERAPLVRRAQREVLRLYDRIELPPQSAESLCQYADARAAFEILRAEHAFNVGVELGVVAGRAQLPPGSGRLRVRDELRAAARVLMLDCGVTPEARLPALLKAAWALATGPARIEDLARAVEKVTKGRGRARRKRTR